MDIRGALRKSGILIDCEKRSWQEAVHICGELMHTVGSAEPEYIDAMVDAIINFGPYIVVAPYIALAHADSKHALKDDLVLAIFREPVIFGSHNDPVHLMFGLCATESDRHLERLQALAEILEDEDLCKKLLQCSTENEVYELIKSKNA